MGNSAAGQMARNIERFRKHQQGWDDVNKLEYGANILFQVDGAISALWREIETRQNMPRAELLTKAIQLSNMSRHFEKWVRGLLPGQENNATTRSRP